MSLLPFMLNFIGAKGDAATHAVVKAMVQLDPEGASKADLATMEQDLDAAGRVITKLRADLAHEQGELDSLSSQYKQMMGAAEVLQKRINDPATADKTSLQASLASLLDRIEHVAPEMDQDKHDVDATQALLADAEKAYLDKTRQLTEAKGNLERAKHDMAHAKIQEDRSEARAQQASVVAGLHSAPLSGLTVALNTMKDSAEEARQRAAANDMKAKALNGVKTASNDPNIVSAMAEANGDASPKTLAERLAALKH